MVRLLTTSVDVYQTRSDFMFGTLLSAGDHDGRLGTIAAVVVAVVVSHLP